MQSLCAALRITLGWVLGGLLFQADYRKASHSWGAMLMVSKDPFLLVRKWTKMHFSLFTLSGEIDCLLLFVVSLCFSGGLQCWMVGARVSTKGSAEAVRQRKEWRLNSIPWSPEGLKWVSCDLKGSCWDLGRGCSCPVCPYSRALGRGVAAMAWGAPSVRGSPEFGGTAWTVSLGEGWVINFNHISNSHQTWRSTLQKRQ